MINQSSGTPFVGYASLTAGSPGPTAFTLFTVMGQASYTLAANERVYITNITVSSGDTGATAQLVTVDTGGTTPTKLVSAYVNSAKPLQPEAIPPGCCRGVYGVVPRATAAAVTANTVELIISGYISRS